MIISGESLLSSSAVKTPSLIGDALLPSRGQLLLTAPTGVGKSVVSMDMAISMILQRPLFGAMRKKNDGSAETPYFPVHNPCKILYFDAEVGQAGLKKRFSSLCDLHCPEYADEVGKHIDFVTDHIEPLSLMTRDRAMGKPFENIREIIKQCQPSEDSGRRYVVIFDPLGDFHEIEENESTMRFVFQRIRLLQNQFNFAAIIPHHESDRQQFTKDGPIERKGTARSRGHSSITQKVDTMLSLTSCDPYESCVDLKLDWSKTRHDQKPPAGYVFCDYSRMFLKWIGPASGDITATRTAFRKGYRTAKITPIESKTSPLLLVPASY